MLRKPQKEGVQEALDAQITSADAFDSEKQQLSNFSHHEGTHSQI